jgi:hypothetical protein
LALALLASGCAANRLPSTIDDAEIIPSVAPLAAETFYSAIEARLTYARLDLGGNVEDDSFLVVRSPTRESDATWKDEEGGERTQYWRIEPDGSIVMTAAIDHGEDALALFDPPLILMPARLLPETIFEHSVNMRVMRASRPESERTHGTCTRTMRYVGDEMITRPDGTSEVAHRIEITFNSTLTLATTEKLTTSWIVPGVGVVAEERSELTKALGLFGEPDFMRLELRAPERD